MALEKYGAEWGEKETELGIELAAIRYGGQWKMAGGGGMHKGGGVICGEGMVSHVRRAIGLLWPLEHVATRWDEEVLWAFAQGEMCVVIGPASSGKTHMASMWSLIQWYAAPEHTVVLVSSTTREMLKQRFMGQVWSLHIAARARWPQLAGEIVQSRLSIEAGAGGTGMETGVQRGIYGVAAIQGEEYKGLGNYVGVKAPRVMMVADELQLLPKSFLDATANLRQNEWFRFIGLGNPISENDALGLAGEPVQGWESVMGAPLVTLAWETRFGGVGLGLCGLDTPNGEEEPPRYPWLISRRKIDEIESYWGKDSVIYMSQAVGRLSKQTIAKRVLTRSVCLAGGVLLGADWAGGTYVDVVGLDAAFGGVGGEGDRCMMIWLRSGVSHGVGGVGPAKVVGVMGKVNIPIVGSNTDTSEDQIARYVKVQLREWGVAAKNFYFDSTTRGTLALALARELGNTIRGVDFGGKAVGRFRVGKHGSDDMYGKRVSELWFAVREAVRKGQCRGWDEELVEEFTSREYGVMTGGKVDVEPKRMTRGRLGRSPDSADAFCVGLDGLLSSRGFYLSGVDEANNSDVGVDSWGWGQLKGSAESIRRGQNLVIR